MTEPDVQGEAGSSGGLTRRRAIQWAMGGLATLAGLVVAIPVLGVLVEPMLRTMPRVWRPVGAVDSFSVGETREVTFADPTGEPWAGKAALRGAWLRRDAPDQFTAFSIDCAHLGCPVRWMAETELFMCPCHGGVYYANGDVAAGPPPHGLSRYPVRVRNGQVEIATVPLPIT